VELMVRFPIILTESLLIYYEVNDALGLSGEPMCAPVASLYGTRKDQYTASQIFEINVQKRQYQKEYMEYWNSTASTTGTGRPVDAIISPLAPFAAARPDMYEYLGTFFAQESRLILFCRAKFGTAEEKTKRVPPASGWVNLLDYSAAVLPVTLVDKNIDVVDVGYQPRNPTDEKIYKGCEFFLYY
jgi:amidase